MSNYIYDAGGERVWKLTGQVQKMLVNGQDYIDYVDINQKTLYTSPYLVANDVEYTKHYYIEGQRICSKLGGGFLNATVNPEGYKLTELEGGYGSIASDLYGMVLRQAECAEQSSEHYNIANNRLDGVLNMISEDQTESNLYFYHSDHLGSSSFISDASGSALQHLQYLPFGETFVDQRTGSYDSRYKFSAKEKDDETGYSYFGARYYDSNLSVWLSVDPMASERSWVSPYSYCQWNPVVRIDPNGELDETNMDEWEVLHKTDGSIEVNRISGLGGESTQIVQYSKEAENGDHIQLMKPKAYNMSKKDFSQQLSKAVESHNDGIKETTGNAAKALNTVATSCGLVTDITKEVVKIPNVGYNIAYNKALLRGVNSLKPISYAASGIGIISDIYLSSTINPLTNNPYQSWGETWTNTTVTGVSLGVGGWPGVLIQADYLAAKAYFKTIWKHPEWAPRPSQGR